MKILKTILKKIQGGQAGGITLGPIPTPPGTGKSCAPCAGAGFNRLSLGMQSADDERLSGIGRVHTMAQTEAAVEAARKAKFQNLSLDLIYGLPHQTLEGWQKNLSAALDLTPEHLSCYGLKVGGYAPFCPAGDRGSAGDDAQADMYLYTVEFLKAQGYEQYGSPTSQKAGLRLRHNLKYWTLGEYAGFGPAPTRTSAACGTPTTKDLEAISGACGTTPHAVGERPHPTPGPGHRMGNAGPADHGGFGPPRHLSAASAAGSPAFCPSWTSAPGPAMRWRRTAAGT